MSIRVITCKLEGLSVVITYCPGGNKALNAQI